MKTSALASYRNRLLLLGAGALLLIGLFWRKKLGPTVERWKQQREWRSEAVPLAEFEAEAARLETKLALLDRRLGHGGPSTESWKPVLDLLAERGAAGGVALAGVAEEHIADQDGMAIRTLPLSLQGRTDALVNTIDALERTASGVHLLSVDLRAKETTYNSPRRLTATLYLQTVSR